VAVLVGGQAVDDLVESAVTAAGDDQAAALWRITAIMAKASITSETWRCHPCQDLLSL